MASGALPAITLTDEENSLLKQCRNESFWKRSLPVMIINFAAIHLLHTKRTIKNYGLKQVACALFSYGIGQLLYADECRKKLFENLPEDSQLLQRLKANQLKMQQARNPSGHGSSDEQVNEVQTDRPFAQRQKSLSNDSATTAKVETSEFRRIPPKPPVLDKKSITADPFAFNEETVAKVNPKPSVSNEPKKPYRTNKYGDIVYSETD
jgi:hypothetical protein